MMFGIKLGLAGLLAVYISQLIRLGHAKLGSIYCACASAGPVTSERSLSGQLPEWRVRSLGGFSGVWLAREL